MSTFLPLGDQESFVHSLKRIPGLESFDGAYIAEMFKASELREYEAEEFIIREGAFDRALYFLLMGEVKVTKEGKEVARINKYGELFGELAVIRDDIRSASVTAVTPCYCLSVDASFIEKLEENEKIACLAAINRICAQVLANRLEKMTNQLVELERELENLRIG